MCEDTPGRSLTPSAMGGYSKKTAIYEPEREASPETDHEVTLVLGC